MDATALSDSEVDRQFKVTASVSLSIVAFAFAVMLLLFPLGETYDDDCGTILQRPVSPCDDRAVHRMWGIVLACFVAAAFCLLAWRFARRRALFASVVLMTVAVVVAGVLLAAPYGEPAATSVGVTFVLHCPGRFSELGGQEHPPPGTEHVCSEAARRRLGLSVVIVILAGASSVAILRRARPRDVTSEVTLEQ